MTLGDTIRRPRRLALAALAIAAAGPVSAQQYYDPGILQSPVVSAPADFRGTGIRLGSFVLSPSFDLAIERFDNIYYEDEDERSDTIYHFRPAFELASGWSRHALTVSASGDFGRYQDNSSEDYDDATLSLDGRIDVQRGKYFTVRTATLLLHEDRASPDDAGGVSPTDFDYNVYGLGYHHTFNRLTAVLQFTRQVTDYDNNINEDGELIDNSDRDREHDATTLRLAYAVAPQRSVFVSVGRNEVRYDRREDLEGFARGNDGYSLRAGVAFDITGVLTGDIYAQRIERDYDDPLFDGASDNGFGLGLNWLPTRLTTVGLRAERNVLETTQPGASGYVSSIYSVRVQHEFRRWLLAHARVSRSSNDYQLSSASPDNALSSTESTRAGLGLSYLFNPYVRLTAGYATEKQSANRFQDRHRANRYFLVLGFQL